jgi:ribonuclease R
MKLLGGKSYRPSNVPELLRSLGRPRSDQQELQETLAVLEKEGRIVRTKGNRYIEAREADLVSGVIQMTRGGRGFVQPDEAGADEISIPERFTGTAMHGDRVLVRRDVRPAPLRRGRKVVDEDAGGPVRSGSVVRILERKRSRMVGTLQEGQRILFVIPDDPRLSHNILVPPPRDVGRRPNPGDKVVVELTSWENRHTNPEGEIVEVLGPPDQEGVDMLSVLRQYDLPLSFPKVVLAEAKSISGDGEVDEADFKGRRDCREDLVITIDPDDAKDFDDAISVRRVGQDRWKLWVHIADVSHYVRPGSALDQEAEARGNSTYLVDRVIPMLPEALSNELCSLKPNVDRLTKCVEFDLDSAGGVLDAKFYPAVIHSKRRFSYQEALAVIEGKAADAAEKMILMAHQLAQKLRRARFKNGSLDLDFPESKIRLDDRGRVTRIDRMDNDVSHQLIEEFMLLANEAVAARLMQMPGNAVYRIHEAPKPERLAEYREQVLAHHVPCGNLERRDEIQKLLKRLSAIPIGGALKIGFLRSLTRARYAMEPLGHFGLAKEKYTHFTSPIRRYADLIVHRVLFEKTKISGGEMKRLSDHISTTERNSADAERDSRDVKLYAFLESQMDRGQLQVYSALVTEVRNFGFFIDVTELGMSGLVHLSSVADDFFDFDPIRLKLVGRQSGREILLGDHVDVQVCRIDRFKKQVDFQLVSEAPAPGGRRPVRKRPQDAERKAGMKGRRRGPQRGKRSRR